MQWQPIETAPKDGTPILGFADGEITTVEWFQIGAIAGYFTLCVCGPWAVDGEWNPTHWMPLPNPPAQDQQRTDQPRVHDKP